VKPRRTMHPAPVGLDLTAAGLTVPAEVMTARFARKRQHPMGFAVLFDMAEIWRASQNKTANPYVIVIAI
jgi:hypothetical protein